MIKTKYVVKVNLINDDYYDSPEEWCDDELFICANHREVSVRPDVCREIMNMYDSMSYDSESTTADYHIGGVSADMYDIYPLYAYIHSGIILSLTDEVYPFNCRWDTSQVGYVIVNKSASSNTFDLAKGLVSDWNMYLSGDVWGYQIEVKEMRVTKVDNEKFKKVYIMDKYNDSCWGYYGYKNALEEANAAKDNIILRLKQDLKITDKDIKIKYGNEEM